jgi:hypothetical protein
MALALRENIAFCVPLQARHSVALKQLVHSMGHTINNLLFY